MTPCIRCKGALDRDGYGSQQRNGVRKKAHVWAYIDAYGVVPAPGICVCHECDNCSCINPKHLFLGTVHDNNADRERKGRTLKGSAVTTSVLTERQVKKIRDLYDAGNTTYRDLADKFGVSKSTIGYVVTREYWKHA